MRLLTILILAGVISSCAPINQATYSRGNCTIVSVDARTGRNPVSRLFDTPHRYLEHTGKCQIIPEDADPRAITSFLGPAVGDVGSHVVIPAY